MKISVFPALNGDSILAETDLSCILIDGGYIATFKKHIKPKLQLLKAANKAVSHLIVTHIDNDHISGILKLVEENKSDRIIKIENVWHNSFRHIADIKDGIVFSGKAISELSLNYTVKDENNNTDKNISAVQGSTLASLLRKYGYNWNTEFQNKAVSIDNQQELNSRDIDFKILSPTNEKLADLKKYWKKELYIKGFSSDEDLTDFNEDAFEYILSLEKEKKRIIRKNVSGSFDIEKLSQVQFTEDDAATNGSSISFILENQNFKILLLADSHPSVIVQSLKAHYNENEFPIRFDLIKVSHHGSGNNTSLELLQYIDSDIFVFSTNGVSHNHPDPETIARIISRKTESRRYLYFNYPLDTLLNFKEQELMEKYNFAIIENTEEGPLEFNFVKNE